MGGNTKYSAMVVLRTFLAIPSILLFLGCSTVSPKCDVPRADEINGATIVVYRPNRLVGLLYATPVSIDQCRVLNMKNNSCVVYRLPEGKHRIAVEKRTVELGSGEGNDWHFEAGKTYYFRQTVSIIAGISLVTEKVAIEEMPLLADLKQCEMKEP